MNTLVKSLVLTSGLLVATAAHAADPAEALAQKSGCLSCHNVQVAVIGPAYKDVATKYKGDKDAEERLVQKVKKGGSGIWGKMPMPPNSPLVKDEDIRTLVKWVLSRA